MSRRRFPPAPAAARAQICPRVQIKSSSDTIEFRYNQVQIQLSSDTIGFRNNRVQIQVESNKLEHLAPSLVEDGEVAVEDVEEAADDVLVRARSNHKTAAVMDIVKPGHRHSRVVPDKLEKRGTEPHEHEVHLQTKMNM